MTKKSNPFWSSQKTGKWKNIVLNFKDPNFHPELILLAKADFAMNDPRALQLPVPLLSREENSTPLHLRSQRTCRDKDLGLQSHRIHVWYIYQDFVEFYGKYTIHGSCVTGILHMFLHVHAPQVPLSTYCINSKYLHWLIRVSLINHTTVFNWPLIMLHQIVMCLNKQLLWSSHSSRVYFIMFHSFLKWVIRVNAHLPHLCPFEVNFHPGGSCAKEGVSKTKSNSAPVFFDGKIFNQMSWK